MGHYRRGLVISEHRASASAERGTDEIFVEEKPKIQREEGISIDDCEQQRSEV